MTQKLFSARLEESTIAMIDFASEQTGISKAALVDSILSNVLSQAIDLTAKKVSLNRLVTKEVKSGELAQIR